MTAHPLIENEDDVDIESYVKSSADPEAAVKEMGFTFHGVNTAQPEDPCKIWLKHLRSGLWAVIVTHDNDPNKVSYFKTRRKGQGFFAQSTELERAVDVPFRDVRRKLMKWKQEDAKAVVHHLLDSPVDALDPRADLENLIQHRCPKCGSSNVIAEDEGTVDCCNCGHWFMEDGEFNLNDEISDLKAYALANGLPPRICTTFSRTTPESVEQGDYSETGWEDEEGVSMLPDEFDREEGLTVTDKAAEFLYDKGAYSEDVSSHFHPGVWYTSGWSTVSYQTGEEEELNYHLTGFTPEQEQEVYNKLQALRKRR